MVTQLAETWEAEGQRKLVTVQVGDCFDMWRQFPGVAHPGEVDDSVHAGLRDILYRGRKRNKACLKATMILGNHDTRNGVPLPEIPYELRAYNRSENSPFLFVTHGDAFELLEILTPDLLQEAVVDFVGKLTPINKYWVGNWGKAAGKKNKPMSELKEAITSLDHPLEIADFARAVKPGVRLPDIFCSQIDRPNQSASAFFKTIYRALQKAERKGMAGRHVRVVAMGHTHHAGMTFLKAADGSRPLLLLDVGAWVEKCSYPIADGQVVTEPSAQLAVIHGNDARLYQVRVPQTV